MLSHAKVVAGPLIGAILYFALTRLASLDHLPAAVAMLGVWMAVWWMTEAVPLELTALLPMLVIPLIGLHKTNGMMQACAPYADKNVFFFLGGFGLGLAIEKTELHRRGALLLLKFAGTRASMVVGSFMIATAILSMWMNNTATTMLMLPLAMSVIATQPDHRFATTLLIGVGYAASIGGMGTLIGTAPNIFFTGFLEEQKLNIGFLPWMGIAMPIVVTLLVGCWFWNVCVLWPMPGLKIEIPKAWRDEWQNQKRLNEGQCWTLGVFFVAALLWMFREPVVSLFPKLELIAWLKSIDDAWIAMASMVALLLFPIGRPVLAWADVERVPWGVLLLFGGGLSLAKAIGDSKLDQAIANVAVMVSGMPSWLIIALVVVLVIAVSELASNLATATTMLPILASAAPAMGVDSLTLLSAAVLASSCGFMLPVATPPNTLVFAQRKFPVSSMLWAGAGLNIMAIIALPIFVLLLKPLVIGR